MRNRLLKCCIVLWALPAFGKTPLTLETLLDSSIKHYPQIQQSQAAQDAQKGAVTAAEGVFDLELNQESFARPNGFYDGRTIDTRLQKRLEGTNTRLYGGYRVSDGTFPIYEDKRFTNENGEYSLGAIFSLLRDRSIDEDRFKLRGSELDLANAKRDVLLTKIGVQHQAMQAYGEWLAAGQIVKVRRDLLAIAQERQSALSQRATRGDVATIAVTENKQYLLSRQGLLNEAEREFTNAANRLSLFWRDEKGEPIIAQPEDLPARFPLGDPSLAGLSTENALEALTQRPEFGQIDANIEKEKNRLALGENRLMPRVDLGLETSRDYGTGSPTREETEALVKLNISIPLQRRAGKGIVAQANANMKELEYQRRLLNDRIRAEIANLITDIKTAEQNVSLADQESQLAQTLQRAEEARFSSGASDFFVVNLREDNVGNARVKQAISQMKLFKSLASYYAATVNLEQLRINE